MSDHSLSTLTQKYQKLKKDKDVSDDDSKYEVMKAMADQLGLPGTPAADILSHFGKPDELTPSLQQGQVNITTMPGPVLDDATAAALGSNQPSPSYYFLYYLDDKNKYLYFKVDAEKETVITSDWNL